MTPQSIAGDDVLSADELSTFAGISGTAEAGATITISSSALSSNKTTTASSSGSWTFSIDNLGLSSSIADGTYSFTVTATDAAGNTSNTATKSVEIDLDDIEAIDSIPPDTDYQSSNYFSVPDNSSIQFGFSESVIFDQTKIEFGLKDENSDSFGFDPIDAALP